jgi:hypothetical protein
MPSAPEPTPADAPPAETPQPLTASERAELDRILSFLVLPDTFSTREREIAVSAIRLTQKQMRERAEPPRLIAKEMRRLREQLAAAEAERDALKTALATAVRLARESTNGWAAHANRNREHDEISRLHLAINALNVPAPPTEAP